MEIVRSTLPILVELDPEDITLMHLAFYEYKDFLKGNNQMKADKKRQRMRKVCRLINLVDLMM